MLTYQNYLLENSKASTKHVATKYFATDGVAIYPGMNYYLDSRGKLHRSDGPAVTGSDYQVWMNHGLRHRLNGPAVIYCTGEKYWYVDGIALSDPQVSSITMEICQWKLLKANIEGNFPVLNAHMSYEMQEYVCKNRPDLINQIKRLSPDLKKKYQHEQELGNIDL